MTTRETDTSESETEADASSSEALFDALVEGGVLAVDAGGVRTTDAFDDTHAVYHDSYVGMDEAEFHEAVAATFGLSDTDERNSSSNQPKTDYADESTSSSNQPKTDYADAAAELVAERGVERTEFICYLAVRSHLDDAGPRSADNAEPRSAHNASVDDLAVMAAMVREVVPDSPVPAEIADVTDDPDGFLAGRDRAVVSVWKRFCDPCEAVKADLDAILDATPDDVAVAGIDGEVATEFCETHEVESAPGFVLFDGREERPSSATRRDAPERARTVAESDLDAVTAALRSVYSE